MNIYAGTLGQLIIVEVFVLILWVRVLLETVGNKDNSVTARRVLLTSLGLVFNAGAITGIMVLRIMQFMAGNNPYTWSVVTCYAILAVGNILFIISASLGQARPRLLQAFIVCTLLWTAFVAWKSYF